MRDKNRGIPPVTIVMSVFNAEPYLNSSLQSVLKQDFSDFELIAVDDRSTDGSLSILREHARHDRRVRVIEGGANQGLTARLNQLIERAKSPFVARMDADDISLPGRLRAQYDHLRANNDVVVVGTWHQVISKRGSWLSSFRYPGDSSWIQRQLWAGRNVLLHGSVMFRRSLADLLETPLYRLPVAQDYDLWLRASRVGGIEILPIEGYALRVHDRSITAQRGPMVLEQTEFIRRLNQPESALDPRDFPFSPHWSRFRRMWSMARQIPWMPTRIARGFIREMSSLARGERRDRWSSAVKRVLRGALDERYLYQIFPKCSKVEGKRASR